MLVDYSTSSGPPKVNDLSGRTTEARPTKQWLHFTVQVRKEVLLWFSVYLQFLSGCSSDELAEIFRHHFELLVNATAPVHRAIACRLYTAGWISKPTKNDATSTGISPELAAMQVVNDLETNLTTKLRSDPDPGGVIVELCRCLERETNYKTIIQSIRRELCKCTQRNQNY